MAKSAKRSSPDKPIRFADGTEMSVRERPGGPGDPLVMEFRLQDQCGAPPTHVHPEAAEVFEVEQGEFELMVDGEWKRVTAGESIRVEPGTPHTFRNHSGDVVVVRNVHDPHHDFEAYIRSVATTMRDEDPDNLSREGMIKMAIIWGRHDDLIRPAALPMKIGFRVLSWLGRARGVTAPD